jgi:hypothetical protein
MSKDRGKRHYLAGGLLFFEKFVNVCGDLKGEQG